uniref:Uncharacterized protein AlNc14C252G9671 n=1 Tax=Albugo laibachii Nc14 TaxID=890382 RepID=F0WTJ2_9STRA|nr:conserved hypothetical protein [Albugo laibachii Nc14]|eukprot:CCA24683.1 conserved hypothetical protein [Albugo laibachii Nc14]
MVKYPVILSLATLGNVAAEISKSETIPTGDTFDVIALGDWGAPLSTSNVAAQGAVATIMALWLEQNAYSDVFDLGDSLYWNGVIAENSVGRMQESFENVYTKVIEKQVCWSGVYGNHDLAGGAYLCIKPDVNITTDNPTRIACDKPSDVKAALQQHVDGQRSYAQHNKLWHPKTPFYMRTFQKGQVTVDAFFVDMNSARVNGVSNICCQCYGQTDTKDCESVVIGHPRCADGKKDIAEACIRVLDGWEAESLKLLQDKACSSKADHKVLISHYNVLLHLTEERRDQWIKTLTTCGVTLSVSGHTHGMAQHEHSGITFVTSGNGGGRPAEDVFEPVLGTTVWKPTNLNYGFTALSFTKESIVVQYVVLKDGSKIGATTAGNQIEGYQVLHSITLPKAGAPQGRPNLCL